MKWNNQRDVYHSARCGHLYLRIRYYSPAFYEWFVEPDDDKSYRRAFDTGQVSTLEEAKGAAEAACTRLIEEMQASLRES